MSHLLDDPVEKVRRARKHVQELKDPLRDFRASYPDSLRKQVDPESGEKRWIMEADPPPVPIEISIILGEAIYQYRSALDHLVWQLVIANGRTPGMSTAFPICDIAKWDDPRTQRRIEGVHEDARTLLKQQQPGNGLNRNREKWLWWLEDLWNVDKHRHLYLAASASGGGLWSHPLPFDAVNTTFIHDGPIERGTVIASVPAEYADVDFGLRPSVTLGEGVSCQGSHVEMLTHEMDVLVAGIIARFRKFFPADGPPLPDFLG